MLSSKGRVFTDAVFGPVARLLVRMGIGPDAVTITASSLAIVAALWLIPTGHLVLGPLVVTALVLADSIDGLMARERGYTTRWGAFLDSTFDRATDAAIFSGLLLWGVRENEAWIVVLSLACLVLGSIVPYARARAEGLGMSASGGIAERADRLALAGVVTFATGLGAPVWVLGAGLVVLALASVWTIGQRMARVYRQARGDAGREEAA
ncbi:MAG TPA: CDP-alcohol phosphatidyltransferase family protein [Actinomycetaceae bacterium]|nr:CDP-alcohol phosphatidyltransferase family protein [Actinomycetaceae bacterium]